MGEEASDSEAPRPISSRTRSRMVKKTKKPAVVLEDIEDDEPVSQDDEEVSDRTELALARQYEQSRVRKVQIRYE